MSSRSPSICEEPCVYRSPIGTLYLADDGRFLTRIVPFVEKTPLAGRCDGRGRPILRMACDWLDRYFSGERPSPFELPLCPQGTPFQRGIWKIVSEIPYGEVASYGEIGKRFADVSGRTVSPCRAIGGALKRNPLLIVIPCHRVIGANGALTGYAGGLAAKEALLLHEGHPLLPSGGIRKGASNGMA